MNYDDMGKALDNFLNGQATAEQYIAAIPDDGAGIKVSAFIIRPLREAADAACCGLKTFFQKFFAREDKNEKRQ